MAKENGRVRYEEELDILDFWLGVPSTHSVELGDFIIDLDKNNNVCGLEILNASESLRMPTENLKQTNKMSMTVSGKNGLIQILLKLKSGNKDKEILIPVIK